MAAEESYPELLFICIFWLLHAIFSLTEYLMAFCYLLSAKWRSVFSHERCVDMDMVRNISKLPEHIAFLVLENDIVYDDLAKLVIWSLLVGINAISLYDVQGRLKKNQGKMLGAINREYVRCIKSADPFKLVWRCFDECEEQSDKHQTVIVNKNGVMYPDSNGNGITAVVNGTGGGPRSQETREVTISLFSQLDGKQDIVRAAQRLASQVRGGALSLDTISTDLVGDSLEATKGLPDPCVLVRLGSLASNVDFLPWQLRLTEMYSITSHRNVTPDKFVSVFRKYGRCEQRLGK